MTKVIIPVVDIESAKNQIANGFHNAEFACVYDTINMTFEWLPFNDIVKHVGNLTLELKWRGINTVITPYMPMLALGLFAESGMKILKSQSTDVLENIQLFIYNQLEPYSLQMNAGISACAGSCRSCGDGCN